MTAQEYIKQRLQYVSEKSKFTESLKDLPLEIAIEKILLSKKFRKYSITSELADHIKNAIKISISKNGPIKLTFLNGAYKLWRLEESPYPDWAELFSIMYFTNWVKTICEVYKPGVWFDFYMDDLIIPKLNNTNLSDVETYIKSFNELFSFLKEYQPKNLKMTLTPVGSKFETVDEFEKSLQTNLLELQKEELPEVNEKRAAMIEMNVEPNEEQLSDPNWKQKIWQLHTAYLTTKREPKYHIVPDKILVFTQPLSSRTVLPVGTTKTSVAKFWVGVGALKPRGDSYIETVLSISQLEKGKFDIEEVSIPGLEGKNFSKIRICK